jgi:hypothetical protein
MFIVRATIYLYDGFMQEKVYADVAANLDQGHVAAWRALITANVLVLEKIERALAGRGCRRSAGTTCCWSYPGRRGGGCGCTSSPARWC